MDLITGKGPYARHSIFYFTEGTLSAVRIDDFKYRFTDQPRRLVGRPVKVDWPILTNLGLDPLNALACPTAIRGGWHSITGLLTSSGNSSSYSAR